MTFLQLKTAVTEKIMVDNSQIPTGVTKENYQITTEKFKATASKKYTTR